jgi:hypothetical protein
MFQTKDVEKIKTRVMFEIFFFRKPCTYEITWKNMVKPNESRIIVK